MTEKDLTLIKVLIQIEKRWLMYVDTAGNLAISERQLYRLMKRYHHQAGAAIIHRRRGKPSNRGYAPEVCARAP